MSQPSTLRNYLIPQRDGKLGLFTRLVLDELVDDAIQRYGGDAETLDEMVVSLRRSARKLQMAARRAKETSA